MKSLFALTVAVVITCALTADTLDHSKDPAYYRCPFGLFNGGMALTDVDGEVIYCDVDSVNCPHYHFCSAGYEDGRSVCCHILGP